MAIQETIESEKRRDSDFKQLETRLTKQLKLAKSELKSLMQQDFACAADAQIKYSSKSSSFSDGYGFMFTGLHSWSTTVTTSFSPGSRNYS
jgi:hypothetical protein